MVVLGYPGIGKSSTCINTSGFIDLESSNFFVDGKRSNDWYIVYCNIATHLSEQGYIVFVSSHGVVKQELLTRDVRKVAAYPSLKLKCDWIRKLQTRCESTHLDKDYRALINAIDNYNSDIGELMSDPGFEKLEIDTMDYNLGDLLKAM